MTFPKTNKQRNEKKEGEKRYKGLLEQPSRQSSDMSSDVGSGGWSFTPTRWVANRLSSHTHEAGIRIFPRSVKVPEVPEELSPFTIQDRVGRENNHPTNTSNFSKTRTRMNDIKMNGVGFDVKANSFLRQCHLLVSFLLHILSLGKKREKVTNEGTETMKSRRFAELAHVQFLVGDISSHPTYQWK